MILEFAKMSGAGNDFIVIDDRGNVIGDDAGELAKQLCRRRVSVGADGLILIVPGTSSDFRMRYINSDGSEADMCGNGGRCAARFAFEAGIAGKEMTFESSSGTHSAQIVGENVRLMMPEPRAVALDIGISVGGAKLAVHRINTGVPHVVHEVEDIDSFPVEEVGRSIRNHRRFPSEGANADFVSVSSDNALRVRTYERGVEGETLACGTGAVAAALVMAALGKVRPPVRVQTRGGSVLTVGFYMSDLGFCDISLEGEARFVYKGHLERSED